MGKMKEQNLEKQQKAFIEQQALKREVSNTYEKLSIIDSLNSENKMLRVESEKAWRLAQRRLVNNISLFLYGVMVGLFLGGLAYIIFTL